MASINVIEAARARRVTAADARLVRIDWFINEVSDKVAMTLKNRMRLATEFVKNKVIRNISRPVTKTVHTKMVKTETGKSKKQSRTVVTDRSKPFEFPKADTTQLLKTVFSDVRETSPGIVDGYIGTPLEYGLFLELKMNRQFLTRTLWDEQDNVRSILLGPIK